MITNEQVKQALLDAADILRIKGWCQGAPAKNSKGKIVALQDPEATNFCAVGALRKATDCPTGTSALFIKAKDAADAAVTNKECKRYVMCYNDLVCKNKRDIINIFKRAAKKL